ncbi:MAG TPA: hypothetical protein VIF62_32235 [Labilithrix sp.]|jgi:tetratricopeptide (TPR) repeat protein
MRWLRVLGVLAVAIVLFSRTAIAQTPPPGKDVAKKLFEEGVELEKKSDFAGALAKYQEAEQITVTPGLHFHLAFCLEMTSKLAAALDAYESALKLARDQNKADVEKAVAVRLEPLRARVPFLAVKLATQAPDVAVKLDGASLSNVLLDGKPFRVDPGDHTINATASGYAPFSKKVQAAPATTTNVDVTLEKQAAASAPTPPAHEENGGDVAEPPAEPPKSRSRVVPLALAGGAVALLAAGIVFYAVADSAASDARDTCPQKLSCDSPRNKVRTFDALALGGFIGAAGVGALAIIAWTSSSNGGASATTRVVASPTSLRLEGSF